MPHLLRAVIDFLLLFYLASHRLIVRSGIPAIADRGSRQTFSHRHPLDFGDLTDVLPAWASRMQWLIR